MMRKTEIVVGREIDQETSGGILNGRRPRNGAQRLDDAAHVALRQIVQDGVGPVPAIMAMVAAHSRDSRFLS